MASRAIHFFESCDPVNFKNEVHELTFDGGNVDLFLEKGDSAESTEPAAFVRAAGTLDNIAFDQNNYFKLIYNPEHHHFSRDFAVLFDTPLGESCGLKFVNLDPWNEEPESEAYRIDCSLNNLSRLTILSEKWTVE